MWKTPILSEKNMQFLVHPGFTEEQINEKILNDEAIFMEEPIYQFVMFAMQHSLTHAIEEVRDGLEYSPEYIFECSLAAVSQEGDVVLLFKPEDIEEPSQGEKEYSLFGGDTEDDLPDEDFEGTIPKVEPDEDSEEESSSDDWI